VSATDDYLTVAEIATILNVNQQTVRNWIDAGKIPALHVGRRVRIRRIDFDQLLQATVTGAGSPPARASGTATSRRRRCPPTGKPRPPA
jgi:excisionase family DNA binding protein